MKISGSSFWSAHNSSVWHTNFDAGLLPAEQFIINKLLQHISSDFLPSSILDVGCATGRTTAALARQFPNSRITGVDLNTLSLANAVLLPNITYKYMDVLYESNNLQGYDLVCMFMQFISMFSLEKAELILTNLRSSLLKGAFVLGSALQYDESLLRKIMIKSFQAASSSPYPRFPLISEITINSFLNRSLPLTTWISPNQWIDLFIHCGFKVEYHSLLEHPTRNIILPSIRLYYLLRVV